MYASNDTLPSLKPMVPAMRLPLLLLGLAGFACSQEAKLPLVAIMPLRGQGVDSSSSEVVSDALADELLATRKVRVMERAQMQNILREQGFQQSGACDGSECAVEVGKLLSIDRMVVGSFGKLGGSYTLSLRLVDVQTGEVLASSRRMRKGEIDDVVRGIVPETASDLVRGLGGVEASSASASDDGDKGSGWGWWLAGGTALVAGGAVAVVLLSGGGSGGGSDSAWTTTVEW